MSEAVLVALAELRSQIDDVGSEQQPCSSGGREDETIELHTGVKQPESFPTHLRSGGAASLSVHANHRFSGVSGMIYYCSSARMFACVGICAARLFYAG